MPFHQTFPRENETSILSLYYQLCYDYIDYDITLLSLLTREEHINNAIMGLSFHHSHETSNLETYLNIITKNIMIIKRKLYCYMNQVQLLAHATMKNKTTIVP